MSANTKDDDVTLYACGRWLGQSHFANLPPNVWHSRHQTMAITARCFEPRNVFVLSIRVHVSVFQTCVSLAPV